ncbi:hypothetical protein Q73A0000_01715 [Kaistella flava (ex Peng et al. 2021)]|uniref:Uncharacterized protein n=1 Tax=Kaistella flava (ex Peng et al. 2021) TaxID=2038776 RepID=A0A7M2Y5N9_9FLAO|nr:hypothetical protein [Kaistella flava (ex Peng et al. 2021)]QOW09159.1 hypothetical protein Q73A0000_01715 [Kaistella flava (ex Peng et al. 2021)]
MKRNKCIHNILLVLVLVVFYYSCTNDRSRNLYFTQIKNDEELQSSYIFSNKDDSISAVQFNVLEGFYNEQKKDFSYKDLDHLLVHLNSLSRKDKDLLYFSKSYKIDNKFSTLLELSTDQIGSNLNLEKTEQNHYILSGSKYKKEKLFTILYAFYIKDNYILYDDNKGIYIIVPDVADL